MLDEWGHGSHGLSAKGVKDEVKRFPHFVTILPYCNTGIMGIMLKTCLHILVCKHSKLEGTAKEGWIKGRKLSDNRRMRFHCSKPHQGPKCPPICGSQVSHCCMQIVTLISPGQPILGGPYNTTPFSCSCLGLGSELPQGVAIRARPLPGTQETQK